MSKFNELLDAKKYQELLRYYQSEAYQEELENISEAEAFANDFIISQMKRSGIFLTSPPPGADWPYEI